MMEEVFSKIGASLLHPRTHDIISWSAQGQEMTVTRDEIIEGGAKKKFENVIFWLESGEDFFTSWAVYDGPETRFIVYLDGFESAQIEKFISALTCVTLSDRPNRVDSGKIFELGELYGSANFPDIDLD